MEPLGCWGGLGGPGYFTFQLAFLFRPASETGLRQQERRETRGRGPFPSHSLKKIKGLYLEAKHDPGFDRERSLKVESR